MPQRGKFVTKMTIEEAAAKGYLPMDTVQNRLAAQKRATTQTQWSWWLLAGGVGLAAWFWFRGR